MTDQRKARTAFTSRRRGYETRATIHGGRLCLRQSHWTGAPSYVVLGTTELEALGRTIAAMLAEREQEAQP